MIAGKGEKFNSRQGNINNSMDPESLEHAHKTAASCD